MNVRDTAYMLRNRMVALPFALIGAVLAVTTAVVFAALWAWARWAR